MAKWMCNGEWYHTAPLNLKDAKEPVILYSIKKHKCYRFLTSSVVNNKTSLYVEDIYTKKRFWLNAKHFELVVRDG